ncbi:MAG: hypothetical protein J6C19_08495 [Lachnospiraceae bacterium]|nr:hypothetical protein [Lachnospiraceae bacterium]
MKLYSYSYCGSAAIQPYGYFNQDEGWQSYAGTDDWTPNANFLMGDAKVFENMSATGLYAPSMDAFRPKSASVRIFADVLNHP